MKNIFENIPIEKQNNLKKILETYTIVLKKGNELNKILYSNILGVVMQGNVQVIKIDYNGNQSILENYTEQMVFGTNMSSLYSDECSLIAKEDSTLLIIEYNSINSSFSASREFIKFTKNLLDIAREEIRKKNTRIEILCKKTIREKLLAYIDINSKNNVVKLDITYTTLSDYLAIDRAAMMREIKNLKEDGIIQIKGKAIYKMPF